MAESGEWLRRIACEDQLGRPRYMAIFITEQGDVALGVPAGEVAVIKPAQLAEFRRAFDDAGVEALARKIAS